MVRLSAYRDSQELVVEVVNRGSDLARSDAARIFEPYWRAANADERADGTGLGLAVVARLVDEWGGRCWARTTGGSTRVGFTMPVAESVQAPTWQQLQDQLG
jgi:signal transduction histidine kinase